MKRDHGSLPGVAVDASVNVNPLGPPVSLDAVFAGVRELAMRYPEIDAAAARAAWARKLGVPVERLLVGNGASELISLTIRALAPRRVVVFEPCYSEYAASAETLGIPVLSVPLVLDGREWATRLDRFAPEPGDLVVIGQPNNPTGHLTPVDRIAAVAERGASVLVDESFLAFVPEGERLSLAARDVPGVAVVQSLTKAFCVPGLRLGVLAAAQDLIERICRLRDPWAVNGVAAAAAVPLAEEDAYLERTRQLVTAERARLSARLASIPGVRVCDSSAPYLLLELPEGLAARVLRDALLEEGVGVRDASTFGGLGERWLRVGVRSAEENDRVADALIAECGRRAS